MVVEAVGESVAHLVDFTHDGSYVLRAAAGGAEGGLEYVAILNPCVGGIAREGADTDGIASVCGCGD